MQKRRFGTKCEKKGLNTVAMFTMNEHDGIPHGFQINLIWPRSISFDFFLCYRIILWIYCVTFKTVLARAAVKKIFARSVESIWSVLWFIWHCKAVSTPVVVLRFGFLSKKFEPKFRWGWKLYLYWWFSKWSGYKIQFLSNIKSIIWGLRYKASFF